MATLSPEIISELGERLGTKPDIMTVGSGKGLILVATPVRLAVRRDEQWSLWGWEQIASGMWREETSSFKWTTTDGGVHEADLDEVGQLPEVFRERVQASTLLTESHDLQRGRIQIIARRSLDGRNKTSWYAVAGGGARLSDPQTAALVVRRTDALKDEYDLH